MIFSASFGCSFLLICMSQLCGRGRTEIKYLIMGIFCFHSASFSGYLLNYNDISPNFCGIIFGLGGVISSIMNIANPILISVYVRDQVSIIFEIYTYFNYFQLIENFICNRQILGNGRWYSCPPLLSWLYQILFSSCLALEKSKSGTTVMRKKVDTYL